jgi:hypothetical protein
MYSTEEEAVEAFRARHGGGSRQAVECGGCLPKYFMERKGKEDFVFVTVSTTTLTSDGIASASCDWGELTVSSSTMAEKMSWTVETCLPLAQEETWSRKLRRDTTLVLHAPKA